MQDFAAIDFETANSERSSVCSVGIVIVRGGEIVDKFYSLIKPEPEYYHDYTKMNELDEQIDDKHNEIEHLMQKWEELSNL